MEEAKAKNGTLKSSPTSVLSSPAEDQSFITPDDNQELDDDTPQVVPPKEVCDTSLSMEEESYSPHESNSSTTLDDQHSHIYTIDQQDTVAASSVMNLDIPMPPMQHDSSDGTVVASPGDLVIHTLRVQVKPNNGTNPHLDSAVQQDTLEASSSPNRTNEEPPEAKIIIGRPSSDDDFTSSSTAPASNHTRLVNMDQIVAKVPSNYLARTQSTKPIKAMHNIDLSRGQIDTAAPFESVRAAVSMFGGIADWKAHRVHTVERRKFIEQELEKSQEEISSYKKQCEAAKEAKMQVLKEVNHTKRLIEELKLKLEMAQKEEEKAKQGAKLAKLRVEEMEQGIADGTSFTAKAQLEVAWAKHAAALAELNTAKDELEQIRKEHALLLADKDEAIRKAEEAETASIEAEKLIKEMTDELLTLKQSLEPARSAHLETDEHRIEAVIAQELENLTWEMEMKLPTEELEKLNEQMLSTKDVRTRLGEAMELLQHTEAKMTNYMELESADTGTEVKLEDILMEPNKNSHKDIETAITAAKKELAEVEQKIEKATDEVNTLKVSATALKSELDKERSELAAIHQREKTAAKAFRSLEAEVNIIKSEITLVQMKAEGEKGEVAVDLPKRLQHAAQEADQAKALAQTAQSALQKAKEEAEQARAGASTMESSLHAAQKEIEAARASEKLALAAINVLAENKSSLRNSNEDSPNEVALSVEEYYELTKRVHEAEEQANTRVAGALSQVEATKESKSKNFNRLEEVKREMAWRKEALELALQKAEKAEEEKLAVEQELNKWRVEHEQESKAVESVPDQSPTPSSEESHNIFGLPTSSGLHHRSTPWTDTKSNIQTELSSDTKLVPRKKKKSFFPRFFMFLFKRKTPSSEKIA